MQNPLEFYKLEKKEFEKQLSLIKKRLTLSSTLRLLLFLGLVFGIYLFFNNTKIIIGIAAIGISLFIYLVSKHTDLLNQKDFINALININKTEINVIHQNLSSLAEGKEFIDPNHYYSYDIDLFGKGSFFQFLNRSTTLEGKKKLAQILTANDILHVEVKQKGIIELAKMPQWRQQFSAIASLTKIQHSAKEISSWIHNYQIVFPKFLSVLSLAFSITSLLIIALVSFNILNIRILILWFFVGLAISGFFIKKINLLYEEADKAKDTFRQYHKLLDKIEKVSFKTQLLKNQQEKIKNSSQKASQIFNQFSKILDALDQRNNIVIAIVANGLFLRDLKISTLIEKWIKNNNKQVENWFEVIAFFDAYNSLANYTFNHPTNIFPKINNNNVIIEAKNIGHPLINIKQRVTNNINLNHKSFFIITGANMAGKSTFLRTISLNLVMANIGLPVCADYFEYTPIKVITSMRTSDSLSNEASYFFSELKRLKFIVDEIKNNTYFIVLDEILKGTNSTDKAIGSKKFLEKLVSSGSTGIIATHDLSLCTIEQDYSQIKNYYFDAEIIENELHFDYKLKSGVCKNMNASFLLKKMKII